MAELWTCPYCNRSCTLQEADVKYVGSDVYLSKDHGHVCGNIQFKICPNPNPPEIPYHSTLQTPTRGH